MYLNKKSVLGFNSLTILFFTWVICHTLLSEELSSHLCKSSPHPFFQLTIFSWISKQAFLGFSMIL